MLLNAVFWIRIRIGFGINRVSGSVSGSGIRNPDPEFGIRIRNSESGSGSRRAKKKLQKQNKFKKFHVWSAGCSHFRAEGFFCSLEILYGGLGIGKLFFHPKKFFFCFSSTFFSTFGHKNPGSRMDPYPDPDWIRIGIQPEMLDPDPYQMNTDPKHWQNLHT